MLKLLIILCLLLVICFIIFKKEDFISPIEIEQKRANYKGAREIKVMMV